jgi:ABC-type lipoprotein export system ATPase subunit
MQQLMIMASEHRITLLLVSHDMALASYFGRIDALSEINVAGAHH